MNRLCPTCRDELGETIAAGDELVPFDEEEEWTLWFCSELCRRGYLREQRERHKDRFELPEDIWVEISIKDRKVYDGKALHQRYVLSEHTLDMVNESEEKYMQTVLQQVAVNIARTWAEDRRKQEDSEDDTQV